MTDTRRRAPTRAEQVDILLAQAVCPGCGEWLESRDAIEWDHHPALALRTGVAMFEGVSANDPRYMRARHVDCHARKTNGTAATSYGSDRHAIAKTLRLENERAGRPKTKARARKYTWPSRPLPSRPFPKRAGKESRP